jgi:glycosyltransferase involved in cell wall biosynthesis
MPTPDSPLRKILLIHQNFPGQFKYLASHLAANPSIQVAGIGRQAAPGLSGFEHLLKYELARTPNKATHRYARPLESAVLHGQGVVRVLQALRDKNWNPDVVLAHLGWGEGLFVKDIWPDTKLIGLCEFYHHGAGVDVGFDPEFPSTLDDQLRLRVSNGHMLVSLNAMDTGIAATRWQRSLFPTIYQPKIHVNHEGVDTSIVKPDPAAQLRLSNGVLLKAGQKIVTYVARNLEPYRGFHIFVRMVAKLLQEEPDCQVLIVGGDKVSYGRAPEGFANWREKMLQGTPLDLNRVHFVGQIPYAEYLKVLQVSAVHVYLTYPFVLSWSLLEAMSAGCVVVGSATPPVMEVIRNGENGLLVNFFDIAGQVKQVRDILSYPSQYAHLRKAARATVERDYNIALSLQRYDHLIGAP